MTLHTEKKTLLLHQQDRLFPISDPVSAVDALIQETCCKHSLVFIYSRNWFQPPLFVEAVLVRNAFGDDFWTQGLFFLQSARALEAAVYLNVPSLDTQSFNLPPSSSLSGSLFFGGSHKNAPGTHYNSQSREHSLLIKPPPPITLTHLLTHSCFSPPSPAPYHHLLAAVGLYIRGYTVHSCTSQSKLITYERYSFSYN